MPHGGEKPTMPRNAGPETSSSPSPGVPRRLCRALVAFLVAAFVLATGIFLFIGEWLVSEDPLQQADAIAVLSGGMPLRALEAANVYRQGGTPKIWLTHSDEPRASLQAMGITYIGEDVYDRQILLQQGVPQDAIQILDPPVRNTADELAVISRALAAAHLRTVIIVTSKVHTRRVRILCRHLVASNVHVLIHGVAPDPFRPRHWWASTTDALDVVREVLGILNAWAGLPLHPAS